MWMLGIGLLLLVLHALDIGPPGRWNFEFFGDLWKFLVPFALAALWWAFSDSTGLTQRRVQRRMDERAAKRRERTLENLGLSVATKGQRKVAKEASGAEPAPYRDPTQASRDSGLPRGPRV